MTDTFRALCQELIDEIDAEGYNIKSLPSSVAIDRARAALAQPEPQGPTDAELRAFYDSEDNDEYEWPWWHRIFRVLLTRYARPAIEPVPKREDVHYAWELHDAEGEWQAGGSANSLDDVQREGNRYLQTYSQDGPHKLIIQLHCVTTIEPVPKREGEQ